MTPEGPRECHDRITDAFREHFARCGSEPETAVDPLSRIDPTVRFVGSAISVLKPRLLSGTIPDTGVHLVQPAIRTRNLALLPDPGARPRWASYFRALGTLRRPDELEQTLVEVRRFLHEALAVPGERLVVRVQSADRDIVKAVTAAWPARSVEFDGQPPAAYRHRYGLADVAGRNCNVAIRVATGEPLDIGNVVVIEGSAGPLGVEFASGVSTLGARIHDRLHPHQAGPIAAAMPVAGWADVRLADALTTTVAMFRAGLRPGGRGRRRTMRGYVGCLEQLRCEAGWSTEDVARVAAAFATAEFGSDGGAGDFLAGCLTTQRKESDAPGEADRDGRRGRTGPGREPDLRRGLPPLGDHADALHPRYPSLDRLPAGIEVPLGARAVLPASPGHERYQRARH